MKKFFAFFGLLLFSLQTIAQIQEPVKWSYSIDENILAVIHNALTKMLNDFMMATEMANVKIKYNELHMWHMEYLKKYWCFFEMVVKQHHDNINEVISSWMSEKVTLSAVLAVEQERIMQHMSEIKKLISSLSVDNSGLTLEFDCIIKHLNVITRDFCATWL
jgi:hypothetical protein